MNYPPIGDDPHPTNTNTTAEHIAMGLENAFEWIDQMNAWGCLVYLAGYLVLTGIIANVGAALWLVLWLVGKAHA